MRDRSTPILERRSAAAGVHTVSGPLLQEAAPEEADGAPSTADGAPGAYALWFRTLHAGVHTRGEGFLLRAVALVHCQDGRPPEKPTSLVHPRPEKRTGGLVYESPSGPGRGSLFFWGGLFLGQGLIFAFSTLQTDTMADMLDGLLL